MGHSCRTRADLLPRTYWPHGSVSKRPGVWRLGEKPFPIPGTLGEVRDALPAFRYHPEPLRTGSVVARAFYCIVCNRGRDYAYAGPTYSVAEIDEASICPWCIADGSAGAALNAVFADGYNLAGLPGNIVAAVTTRTPGYLSWQQDCWQVHCDDACAFVDRVGKSELDQLEPGATKAMVTALGDWGRTDDEREELLSRLHRDGDLTGYLFRCLVCGQYLAHVDAS